MDPLSFTSGVLTLLSSSITAIQSCQTLAAKYKIAELSISSVRTECASIRIALLQIQSLISRTPAQDLRDRFQQYVVDEYKAVLGACSLTFALLNERLEILGLNRLNHANKSEVGAKLRFLWNEAEMDMIRQNIRGQAMAVSLLVTAFQSETATKSYEILMNQQAKSILASVSNDAKTLREASLRPRAEASDDTTGSIIGDEEFSFDDIVINSQAYRRAFLTQQKKLEVHSIQEEEANVQISNMSSSGDLSRSPSTPRTDELDITNLNRSAYANPLRGGGRKDKTQPPKRPLLWRNHPFLGRFLGVTSDRTNKSATNIEAVKKLPSTKPSLPLKSESYLKPEKQAVSRTTTTQPAMIPHEATLVHGDMRPYQKDENYEARSIPFPETQELNQSLVKLKDLHSSTSNLDTMPMPSTAEKIGAEASAQLSTLNNELSTSHVHSPDKKEQPSLILKQVLQLDYGSSVFSTAFSRNGSKFAAGSCNGAVIIWEADQQGQLQQIQQLQCDNSVWSLAFSPDGLQLATTDSYGKVLIWDADQQGQLQQVQQLQCSGFVTSLTFSPDGIQFATGDSGGIVLIWEADQQGRLQQVQQLQCRYLVRSLAFSPDELQLATGDSYGTVLIWEAAQQGRLQQLQQLNCGSSVWSLAFSPNGNQLATGDPYGTVLIWEADQQGRLQQVQRLRCSGGIRSFAFSPGGRLATGNREGKVSIWGPNKQNQQVGLVLLISRPLT